MKAFTILLALIGTLGSAFAGSDLDFTLSNETNRSFEAVYISSSRDKDWDGNILPNKQVLKAGGQLVVRFAKTDTSPTWDLRIVDGDGLSVTFEDVNLAGKDKVTLKEVGGKVKAEVE